jgi:hypothetical protein
MPVVPMQLRPEPAEVPFSGELPAALRTRRRRVGEDGRASNTWPRVPPDSPASGPVLVHDAARRSVPVAGWMRDWHAGPREVPQ